MNYITNVSIKNFYSIKNEISVFFQSNAYLREYCQDRVFNDKYNKTNVFYGANASGKTTILKAIVFVASVFSSKDKIPKFFKNIYSNDEETFLKIEFIIKGDKYKYEIYFKDFKLDNEILYKNDKLFFDRKKKQIDIKLPKEIKENLFDDLNEKEESIANKFKPFNKEMKLTFEFFEIIKYSTNIENIYITKIGPDYTIEKNFSLILENEFKQKRDNLKNFIVKFLNSINIDIKDFELVKENEEIKVYVIHNIDENKSLEFNLESDGTIILIKLLVNIFICKISNSVLIIDEIDSMIHPLLVPVILNLVQKNDIQIIYSTHNIYNMKFLYKSEIFIVKKDNNHNTTIEALRDNQNIDDFENILTLYENGEFGGIPDIKQLYTEIL